MTDHLDIRCIGREETFQVGVVTVENKEEVGCIVKTMIYKEFGISSSVLGLMIGIEDQGVSRWLRRRSTPEVSTRGSTAFGVVKEVKRRRVADLEN